MCLILISSKIENFEEIKLKINQMIELYEKDPIGFHYVDSEKYPDFEKDFGNSKAIVYKLKRNKYQVYEGDDFKAFIDEVLSGNGRFSRLPNGLNFESEIKAREDL
jgi:hypothetical protein